MSDLSVLLTPGYTFQQNELVTIEKLNALSSPTILLLGSIGSLTIADLSVTTAKLATGALANSSTGRSKMEDGYLSADAEGRAKMAAGFLSADATGRAKMADGYLSADATGLAKMQDGFLTADTAGRAKMADGYLSADATGRAKVADTFVNLAKLAAGVAALPPFVGRGTNIVVKNGAGGVTKLDVTADEVVLADPTGLAYRFTGVTLSGVDVTVAQNLNGRDTAAGIILGWYYLWLITDGTTLKGVLSVSTSAATVETNLRAHANFTGYNAKCLVGFGFNTNAGVPAFGTIFIQDRQFFIPETAAINNGNGSVTYASLSIGGGLAPGVAKSVSGAMGTSTNTVGKIAVAADVSGNGAVTAVLQQSGVAFNNFFAAVPYSVPIRSDTPSTIYWKAAATGTDYRITISGGTW